MNNVKQTESEGRIRYSITSKLNARLFFRLVGLFISINITIIFITAVCLAVYCESTTRQAIRELYRSGLPVDSDWRDYSAVSVREVSGDTVGQARIDWPFKENPPFGAKYTARGLRAEYGSFVHALGSIKYVVNVGLEDGEHAGFYEITLEIGPFIFYYTCAFIALLAFELLTLLTRSCTDRRMVRRTLDPISELAKTAQTLHNVNKQLDLDKTMALAGRLDGIDGNRLDTRIQVDDLQAELKNVAVAINGMLDRINESYAMQARFVSDASHELRTPISVIQGYVNLLDRWGKNDEKTLTESISAIKDEAGNMKDLVEQLLFLARGDNNTIRLESERIELSEIVDEVVSESRMLDSGHIFKVQNCGGAVLADRTLIKQALRILIDNAIKYTDNGGSITVSADSDATAARLIVTDNGVGINPEIIPRIFDRFVRADESRARATGGAGLGLSIAQWIAARHNGHLEVLSREGIGTRVTLCLPPVL